MRRELNDDEANEFYADRTNQRVTPGSAVRPPRPGLGGSMLVRFPTATVEVIKRLADAKGLMVSAWVRRSVERDLARHSDAGNERTDVATELERLACQQRTSA